MEDLDDHDYDAYIDRMRVKQYPMLKGAHMKPSPSFVLIMWTDALYLDHAGTTLYPKALIDRYSADLLSNLYGNPHSASPSSQLSTRRVDDVRLKLLRFFNADPEDFDLVFVANATAGIKLVADAFREQEGGFWFGYHRDCHTSVVGVRELAEQHHCFDGDHEVEDWLSANNNVVGSDGTPRTKLFAYPGQSNMNGRRLPLTWCGRVRSKDDTYTLFDAAAQVSSAPLDLSDAPQAPDFTVLSLYKIFGFPDLGALIVRKAAGCMLQRRAYFGGGTVEMVLCLKEQWHARKADSLHTHLEDGTLPIHSIVAADAAMDTHLELFGSLRRISRHATYLADKLYNGLKSLKHANGTAVCQIYKDDASTYGDSSTQGPVIAFNLRNSLDGWHSSTEVEKLAAVRNIHLRTGGLCNPGGIASSLGLAPWEMRANFSAGQRCGNENDVMAGKPTGMIRVSVGAMSTIADVDAFLNFMREFFVEEQLVAPPQAMDPPTAALASRTYYVESLTVYPVKSCAGMRIPLEQPWEVQKEGLAWDREWCLVHRGTSTALSQKRYPRMALIRPTLDFKQGLLRIRVVGADDEVTVPLSANPNVFTAAESFKEQSTNVCGDTITAQIYNSLKLANFFSEALGVDCQLARFPATGTNSKSARHSKAHLQSHQKRANTQMPGSFPVTLQQRGQHMEQARPILLSNESPILLVSRSSLNRLNERIKANNGKAAQAEVFRANIVIAEDLQAAPGTEQPYAEDYWRHVRIGSQLFQMLGACRRCQMVCVDQATAIKNEEPFVTLAKTRKFDGKVFFGQHACHVSDGTEVSPQAQHPTIKVGDRVIPFENGSALR